MPDDLAKTALAKTALAQPLTASGRVEPVKATPADQPLGLWSAFRAARRNILEMIPRQAFEEPMLHNRGFQSWRMIMDPGAVEHVLKTRARDYPRSDVTLRILQPRQGESLFTAPWDDWRWQHRAIAPIFQNKNLMAVSSVMTMSAEATAARLAAAKGEAVDVYDEMITATFDVINDAALSGRERMDRDATVDAITLFIERIARVSLLDILGAPRWVPRPARLLSGANRQLDDLVDGVIARRIERGPSERPDLLDLLIAAEDPETGRKMTPAELRNNLLAFIVAGHETTALALTWALYLVSLDRDAQRKARDEAQAALGDGPATAEHLPKLVYTRQILDEALRLYPPAAFLSRTAKTDDDVILDLAVLKNETVMIPIYAIHRHRALWDEPDAFAPERFAPEAVKARPRYAYLPFGAGPRICIGMNFALIEATIILATLLARFDFALTPKTKPEPVLLFTLRPKGGAPLTATRL